MDENILSNAINQKVLPSLNGLRGISIILVVLSHLPINYSSLEFKIFNGHLGVNIFFCLSGFLITTLCLKEKQSTGSISLSFFYTRRILRIFPVAYLYLALLYLLNIIYHLDIANFQLLAAMFYITDFSYFRSHNFTWFTGHYWSLSVEEQFYLIFPYVLKKSDKVFIYLLILLIFILPFICLIVEFYPSINTLYIYGIIHFFIKFQSISVGCLFSIIAFKKGFDNKYFRCIQSFKIWGNSIALVLIFYLEYDSMYSLKAIFMNLIISLLTLYIIISNIENRKDIIYKILNNKILSFVGVLSYSIYIWQQIFTSKTSNLPKFLVLYPYNLILIIIIPVISYFYFEQYFLRLKVKFSRLK